MTRRIITWVLAALAAVFFFRFLEFGAKWLSGATSPEFNYKALTAWAGIYCTVCLGAAWTARKWGGVSTN